MTWGRSETALTVDYCQSVVFGRASRHRKGTLSQAFGVFYIKAGEGIRTLDINVGNVALYQLSYARTN